MSKTYVYLQEFNSVIEVSLLARPLYEVKGNHSFNDGQELILGVHFEFGRGKQIHTTDEQQWKEMSPSEQDGYFEKIAVPIQGKQTGDEVDLLSVISDIVAEFTRQFLNTSERHRDLPNDSAQFVTDNRNRIYKALATLPASDAESKDWKEECERLAKVAEYWQQEYYKVVPPHQNPKIDNLT